VRGRYAFLRSPLSSFRFPNSPVSSAAFRRFLPFTNRPTTIDQVRINEQIRAPQLRVVDSEGQHGIMSREQALDLARLRGLDLVEIAPQASPPVCKIIDFGKFRYEQQKREKEARRKTATTELKEIRFGPNTDTHDFEFKLKHAKEFLTEGDKVKAYVQFRGRAIVYKDRGLDILDRFKEALGDLAKVDQPPSMEGRRMTMILSPAKKKA
jgi:translation initiation factor IF-3